MGTPIDWEFCKLLRKTDPTEFPDIMRKTVLRMIEDSKHDFAWRDDAKNLKILDQWYQNLDLLQPFPENWKSES